MASTGGGSGATVTFESIDGPPPQVFDRMVGVLDSESKLRNLSIVSREGTASYRVRSYLAAQVNHGRTTISWVWDVYDANQQRALRLAGEEPAGKSGRDAWAARRRPGIAPHRAGRFQRAQRHDQRDRPGGRAATGRRTRIARPGGGECGAKFARARMHSTSVR